MTDLERSVWSVDPSIMGYPLVIEPEDSPLRADGTVKPGQFCVTGGMDGTTYGPRVAFANQEDLDTFTANIKDYIEQQGIPIYPAKEQGKPTREIGRP